MSITKCDHCHGIGQVNIINTIGGPPVVCPYCSGHGHDAKAFVTITQEMLEQIQELIAQSRAQWLLGEKDAASSSFRRASAKFLVFRHVMETLEEFAATQSALEQLADVICNTAG